MCISRTYYCLQTLTTFFTSIINIFFFKQKTAYEMRISDWSSDVCSSDLLIVPNSFAGKGDAPSSGAAKIPETHLQFAADLLGKFDVDAAGLEAATATRQSFGDHMHEDGAAQLLEVAFRPPLTLIANALGVPPPLRPEAPRVRHERVSKCTSR